MTVTAILLTIGRFRIHWRKNRRFGWDDYFNAIALVFLLIFTITYQLYVPIEYNAQLYALGLSDRAPTNRDQILDMKLNVVNIVMFFSVIYSVKASFLALYWQIFEVSPRFRKAWWCVMVYTLLCYLVSFTAIFWNCGSPAKFLDPGESPNTL
jgi:magnesium-transporting ATPase (P-type)